MHNNYSLVSFLFCVIFLRCLLFCLSNPLKTVNDDDLIKILRTETRIVAFFTTENCLTCIDYEKEIRKVAVSEESNLIATQFIKVINSQLISQYGIEEPSLIYFRHGIPLLYHGPINNISIYEKFVNNQIPRVIELDDQNFEHLTQASTGSTTGDFLILFYSKYCVECKRFFAKLEAIGAHFSNHINVARVDIENGGQRTAKRFQISHVPDIIFIQRGRFYRYLFDEYEIQPLIDFLEDSYFLENNAGESVPIEKTMLNQIIENIRNYFQLNQWLYKVAFLSFLLGLTIAYMRRR